MDDFTNKNLVTKSGATLTYGPYDHIPPSTNREFIDKYQQPVVVHYNHEQPVVEVLSLQRSVEISHWGANMNTEDRILLHNAGPKSVCCNCSAEGYLTSLCQGSRVTSLD